MSGLRAILLVIGSLILYGCVTQTLESAWTTKTLNENGVTQQDISNLENGRLGDFFTRYERYDIARLSVPQYRLFCETAILLGRYKTAAKCLNAAKNNSAISTAQYKAKQALIYLQQGQHKRASLETLGSNSKGGRYIHALSGALRDQAEDVWTQKRSGAAVKLADEWRYAPHPRWAFAAANLYMAADRPQQALDVLFDSETQLIPRYGIGKKTNPEALRVDLFDEFRFGLTELSDVGPASNMALELLYAIALEQTGQSDKSLEIANFFIQHPLAETYPGLVWQALALRGRLQIKRDQPNLALEDLQKAIDLVEVSRAEIDTESGRLGFATDKTDLYNRTINLLIQENRPEEAFHYSERNRSRTLVELLKSKQQFVTSKFDSEADKNAVRNFITSSNNYQYAVSSKKLRDIRSAGQSLEASRTELQNKTPDIASLLTVSTPKISDLQQSLGLQETAISYVASDAGYDAFIITQNSVKSVALHQPNLRQSVIDLDKLIKFITPQNYENNPEDVDYVRDEVDDMLGRLYDDLFAPIAPLVLGNDLTIIPSEELFYLPFAALQADGKFLVEDYNIRYLPSLSFISTPKTRPAHIGSHLVLGDPDTQQASLKRLPSAREEAMRIAAHVENTAILVDADATETAFRTLAPFNTHIHVASHAEFDLLEPLNSSIHLAPDADNDGTLNVGELYDLTLNARTVVISACNTNRSVIRKGGELIGLIRGFLFAGTDTYVGSLWQVPDESTAILMERFYIELQSSKSVGEALAKSQRYIINTYDPEPYFWAAFTAYGHH